MEHYIALFLAPASVLEEWAKTPEDVRMEAEKKMKADWDAWMDAHKDVIKETKAGGATKRVDSTGISDTKNNIMLYTVVTAESHETATKIFENHPHLTIPQSSIEVMAIREI